MNLSGGSLFESDHVDTPYRKLLCIVIRQAFYHARGLEIDCDGKPTRLKELGLKATAVEYLLSTDFEDNCYSLNFPCDPDVVIERVRKMITEGEYQMPAFTKVTEADKEAIRREYIPKVTTQREVARKYDISPRYVRNILTEATV